MSWGAVIVGAASVVGGAISANGAKKGGDAAAQGNMAAIAEQRRQYDQTRADMEPWRVAGADGLNRLNALLANPDSIQDSAAYQWRIGQGVHRACCGKVVHSVEYIGLARTIAPDNAVDSLARGQLASGNILEIDKRNFVYTHRIFVPKVVI